MRSRGSQSTHGIPGPFLAGRAFLRSRSRFPITAEITIGKEVEPKTQKQPSGVVIFVVLFGLCGIHGCNAVCVETVYAT